MDKYGLRVITRQNPKTKDNFLIIQYKLDCMKNINIKKVLKWVIIIASALSVGSITKPVDVVKNIAIEMIKSDSIK